MAEKQSSTNVTESAENPVKSRQKFNTMATIYFLNHPANEPGYHFRKIGSRNSFHWNTSGQHWRKFIKREGNYINNSGMLIKDELYFWGEYEPYSDSVYVQKKHPYAVHSNLKPVGSLPPRPYGALNTDPYVYGCFRNICCRRRGKRYQSGDVLVFGTMDISSNTMEFDTIIVVDELIPISALNPNSQYHLASVKPLVNPPKDYVEGLMYKEKKQYYSFVPCLPASLINHVMGKTKISHAASIFNKPKLSLGIFGTKVVLKSPYIGKACAPIPFQPVHWNMIITAVHTCGLELGVEIKSI